MTDETILTLINTAEDYVRQYGNKKEDIFSNHELKPMKVDDVLRKWDTETYELKMKKLKITLKDSCIESDSCDYNRFCSEGYKDIEIKIGRKKVVSACKFLGAEIGTSRESIDEKIDSLEWTVLKARKINKVIKYFENFE